MDNVVIFVRVSKGIQDYERQIEDLTQHSKLRSYNVVKIITEKVSGEKKNNERKAINELMALAQAKKVKRVLVSEVSRLGRKTSEVLQILEYLAERRVSVYAHNYNIDTLNDDGTRNPIAQFMFTMLAEFARMERENLIQRIHSGLDEARRKGKILGRKPGSAIPPEKFLQRHKAIVKQLKMGKSIRDIAAICDAGTATVQKVKKILNESIN